MAPSEPPLANSVRLPQEIVASAERLEEAALRRQAGAPILPASKRIVLSGGRMPEDADGLIAASFSTAAYKEREAAPAWREVFGRTVVRVDIGPLTERFEARARAVRWNGFGMIRVATEPVHQSNSSTLIDNDDFSFGAVLPRRGRHGVWAAARAGRSVDLTGGDGMFLSNGELGSVTIPEASRFVAFSVSAAAVKALMPEAATRLGRRVPAANPELRLLMRYLELARDERCLATPQLRSAFAEHVADLLVLCLGARRDAAEAASLRGVRAARLAAMKADILAALGSPGLSVGAIALRHGVTPRYVQSLFETDGTTFTAFVLAHRLAAVQRALVNETAMDKPISELAYEAGFSDLSHFNRAFRHHFGCTPRDIRQSAKLSKR